MKIVAAAGILCVTAIGVAVLTWLSEPTDERHAASTQGAAHAEKGSSDNTENGPAESAAGPGLRSDAGGPDSASGPPDGDVQEPERHGPSPTSPHVALYTDDAFLLKYASYSARELVRVRFEMRKAHKVEKERLLSERYAGGFYRSHPFLYDTNGNLLGYEESIVIQDIERPWFKKVWEDAETKEWRVVLLPTEEYPELYGQFKEMQWLARRASDLMSEESDRK